MSLPLDRRYAVARSEGAHQAVTLEIAQEKAASLGRAGRRLDDALAALQRLDGSGPARPPSAEREDALTEAAEALFFFVVQREACGLRDTAELLRELGVPMEVQLRMGVRPRPDAAEGGRGDRGC
jgi:hypothetical protein